MIKAQVSTEYLIIVGFVMGITIPLLIVYFTFTEGITNELNYGQLDKVVKSMVDSADIVYFLGVPSQTTIKVYIPINVKEIILKDKSIIYRIKTRAGTSDIVYVSSANLTGALPINSGTYLITVKATSDKVAFSYD
ncbi:MAG: hypothetical protein AABY14_00890 [Nanoarchaeota archaeon]